MSSTSFDEGGFTTRRDGDELYICITRSTYGVLRIPVDPRLVVRPFFNGFFNAISFPIVGKHPSGG